MSEILKAKWCRKADNEKQQSCLASEEATLSLLAVPSDISFHISKYHSLDVFFLDIMYWLPPVENCWFSTSHHPQTHTFPSKIVLSQLLNQHSVFTVSYLHIDYSQLNKGLYYGYSCSLVQLFVFPGVSNYLSFLI